MREKKRQSAIETWKSISVTLANGMFGSVVNQCWLWSWSCQHFAVTHRIRLSVYQSGIVWWNEMLCLLAQQFDGFGVWLSNWMVQLSWLVNDWIVTAEPAVDDCERFINYKFRLGNSINHWNLIISSHGKSIWTPTVFQHFYLTS